MVWNFSACRLGVNLLGEKVVLANVSHAECFSLLLVPGVWAGGMGWRVLRISSDGDDRRIFLGLKFSIPGFFG